jgi:CRISPR-associated protein Cas2
MLEVTPQLYVGKLSAKVRDEVWLSVSASVENGVAVLIRPDANEQGFKIETAGTRNRSVQDFDGLSLITFRPNITETSLFDNKTVNW